MNTLRIRLATALVLSICAFGPGRAEPETTEKDRFDRVDDATYRTVAGPVTVLVGVRLADLHRDDGVLALQVAVGTREDGPPLLVSRGSFSVSTGEGGVRPMLPREGFEPERVISDDRRIIRVARLNDGHQFDSLRRIKTRFFPVGRGTGTRDVELDPGTYIEDTVYFAPPVGGVDGDLVLHFVAGGLPEPIEVAFRLPPPRKKKKFWN